MVLRKKHNLGRDFSGIIVSILFTIILWQSGLLEQFVGHLDGFSYLGIFLAGMLFTSVFTTAPAIAILALLSHQYNPFLIAFIGGVGAMLGDFVIFRIVHDNFSKDVAQLMRRANRSRFRGIFHTRLFKWFVPFLGALVIASPLPDEIGAALLGVSCVDGKFFLAISYIFNTLGILAIALLAA